MIVLLVEGARDMEKRLINDFEKTYKRITFFYYLCLFGFTIVILVIGGKNNVFLSGVAWIITYFVLKTLRNYGYSKEIYYKIKDKFSEDLDISFVLQAFNSFVQNKKRVDYGNVLFGYLNYLAIACEFEEFRRVYSENRVDIQKRLSKSQLSVLLNIFLGICEDRSRYKESLFKHIYTSYHTKKGKLSRLQSHLRQKDILHEISQHYSLGEYELILIKVAEIEQDGFENNNIKLLLLSMKERSLYHLNKEWHLPDERQSKILAGLKWKYLIENGQEYRYEGAEEVIALIDQDIQHCSSKFADCLKIILKRVLITLLVIFLVVCAFFLFIKYELSWKKTTINIYNNIDNGYEVKFEQIGEALFFGDHDVRITLKDARGKKVDHIDATIANDGGTLTEYNAIVSWDNYKVKVTLRGSEQEDKVYEFSYEQP